MKKKKVTRAVLIANRANAKKSSGPRTTAGKSRAKANAITHGFFARVLVLNDEEARQLELLRRSLHPELAPNTILQSLKFEEIVVHIGRCKVATSPAVRSFDAQDRGHAR